jgi:integrase
MSVKQRAQTSCLRSSVRAARKNVDGLPEGFRYRDLRHYFASLIVASGADVKVVQRRLRHASATTTLNAYGHKWPDADESSRAAVEVVLAARKDSRVKRLADQLRTRPGSEWFRCRSAACEP